MKVKVRILPNEDPKLWDGTFTDCKCKPYPVDTRGPMSGKLVEVTETVDDECEFKKGNVVYTIKEQDSLVAAWKIK